MTSIFKYKKTEPSEKKISPQEITDKPRSTFNVKPPEQEVLQRQNEFNPLEEEDIQRDIEKSQARTTSRIGERILGFPGDVQNLIRSFVPESLQPYVMGVPLPSSQQLQEFSEKASLGYTKPENEIQEKTDEFVGDIGSMMIPGGPGYSLSRNIGIPLAGAVVKEATDNDYAKMGTMFFLDLISGKRAQIPGQRRGLGGSQRYINSLFDQARQSLPEGAHFVDVSPMVDCLNTERAILMRGGGSPSRQQGIDRIDRLLTRINNGQMDVHEFMPARESINELITTLGGWNFELPPAIRRRSIANLNRIKGSLIEAGENYGRQENPQFFQSWRDANEAQTVLSRSNVVANFIQRNIGRFATHPITKSLFGLITAGSSIFKPSVGAVGLGALGIYEAGKLLYRVYESPTLRRFYSNAVRGAINGQKGVLTSNVEKLDKEIKKEEKEKEKKKKKLFEH
jgi:hypothetical protein